MSTHCTSIRAASPRDAKSLASVHEHAWRYAYTGILPFLELEKYIAKRDALWWSRFLRQDPDILLLNFNETLIGYATIGENRNHQYHYHGEIMELYIHPDYHGLGFGSRLFKIARKQLKRYGLQGLFLWSLNNNDSAKEFYSHMGGRIITRQEDVFGNSKIEKIGFGWEN